MPSTNNVTKKPAVKPAPVEPTKVPEATENTPDNSKILERLANEIKQRDALIERLKSEVDTLLRERAAIRQRLRNTIGAIGALAETALISETECVEEAEHIAKQYHDSVSKEAARK